MGLLQRAGGRAAGVIGRDAMVHAARHSAASLTDEIAPWQARTFPGLHISGISSTPYGFFATTVTDGNRALA